MKSSDAMRILQLGAELADCKARNAEMYAALCYVRDMVESGNDIGMSKILQAIAKAEAK